MIAALVEHARQTGHTSTAGFSTKTVRWMIQISGGQLTGVMPLGDDGKGQNFTNVPDMRGGQVKSLPKVLKTPAAAHFLIDACSTVVRLPAQDKQGNLTSDPKDEKKHQGFLKLLNLASDSVPECGEIARFLENERQLTEVQKRLLELRAKVTDKVSFEMDGRILIEQRHWHAWWRRFGQEYLGMTGGTPAPELASTGGKNQKNSPARKLFIDFATGELTEALDRHLPLTNLGVGAAPTGASLISFNENSFESHGLKFGENCATSETNAAIYRGILDNLLSNAKPLGQMKVVVWFTGAPEVGQSLFDSLTDPNAEKPDFDWNAPTITVPLLTVEQVRDDAEHAGQQMLNAVRSGEVPGVPDAEFSMLALSGAQGRVMVRGWETGKLTRLTEAIDRWFADLSVQTPTGRISRQPKFNAVLMNILPPKGDKTDYADYLKPLTGLTLPLWTAALNPDALIPYGLLSLLVQSNRSHVLTGKFTAALKRDGKPEERQRIFIRMGLIRAFHTRRLRGATDMTTTLTPGLNPALSSKAYQCGRLMSVLAEIQDAQEPDRNIGAGIIQRYYGAASTTPALVLGRLTRLSQHHLSKVARRNRDQADRFNTNLASIWTLLGDSVPKTLNLEEQSLFALGYYQQLAFSAAEKN